MTLMILILTISLALAIGTLWLVAHDGRGPAAPPRSHPFDPFTTTLDQRGHAA